MTLTVKFTGKKLEPLGGPAPNQFFRSEFLPKRSPLPRRNGAAA
jgi:hypothetical protein